MKSLHIFLLTFCSIGLASCLGSQAPAPVSKFGASAGQGSAGSHIVASGDTLWSISNRYDIVMRDIAYANNLKAPFLLNEGQRLKLPPPPEYRVRSGDTLYEVSRLFNTSTSELARLNNLSPPYVIRAGQELRLDFAPIVPEVAGPVRYRLTVEPPSGDRDPSNDADSLLVLVQPPEVVTTLYLSNRVHPLYPFLKRTLAGAREISPTSGSI